MLSPEVEQRVLDQLICHYIEAYPREAVGVVLRDTSIIQFRNWSNQPHQFLTAGFSLLRTKGWKAWRHGKDVVYLYHSHRQSTSPSQIDQGFMRVMYARWPHVQHLIFTPDRRYEIWGVS